MARYDSLLVRIWKRGGAEAPQWSIQVTHVQEDQSHRFFDPEALIGYLRAVMGTGDPPHPARPVGKEQDTQRRDA